MLAQGQSSSPRKKKGKQRRSVRKEKEKMLEKQEDKQENTAHESPNWRVTPRKG